MSLLSAISLIREQSVTNPLVAARILYQEWLGRKPRITTPEAFEALTMNTVDRLPSGTLDKLQGNGGIILERPPHLEKTRLYGRRKES